MMGEIDSDTVVTFHAIVRPYAQAKSPGTAAAHVSKLRHNKRVQLPTLASVWQQARERRAASRAVLAVSNDKAQLGQRCSAAVMGITQTSDTISGRDALAVSAACPVLPSG